MRRLRPFVPCTDKPFFMKVSPHMPDAVAFCKMVIEAGGNGVVAMNSLGPAMTIDLKKTGCCYGECYGRSVDERPGY